MANGLTFPLSRAGATSPRRAVLSSWPTCVAGLALLLLLLTVLPLFLCLPLWADTIFFDYCARTILRGGIVYRDVFLHEPPGMVGAVTLARAAVGLRSEALRLVDFLIVAAIIFLLVSRTPLQRSSPALRLWAALVLFALYFRTSEFCHCQPDVWMFLPAMAAFLLRQRQTDALISPEPWGYSPFLRASAEGICWGLAFLMKPFIILPGVLCWLASVGLVLRTRQRIGRRLGVDLAGLLLGGLLVGGLVLLWLHVSGNWPYFSQTVLGDWNNEYYEQAPKWDWRIRWAFKWLLPVSMIHLVALPAALAALLLGFGSGKDRLPRAAVLLAAFYLGWFIEGNFWQQQFDYHLVPPLLLGAAVLLTLVPARGLMVAALLIVALWQHPLLQRNRLSAWSRCWEEGSTPALRDQLSLVPEIPGKWFHHVAPTWVELEKVADYLRERQVRDGELTCLNLSTIDLYDKLEVRPSTRYVMLWTVLFYFRNHAPRVCEELLASPQRFIVTDSKSPPLPPEVAMLFAAFNAPVVFEAGRYQVYEVPPHSSRSSSSPPSGR